MDDDVSPVIADASADPEVLYLREWARVVMNNAYARLEQDFARKGEAELFETLAPVLFSMTEDGYASLSQKLNLTPGTVKVRIYRLRRQYREAIRAEVADGLDDATLLDQELQTLQEACRDGSWLAGRIERRSCVTASQRFRIPL